MSRSAELARRRLGVEQMAMPVAVLAFFNAARVSRFMRASMLDNLNGPASPSR